MRPIGQRVGAISTNKFGQAVAYDGADIFAGHRQHSLALDTRIDIGAPQDGVDGLLDELRLAFLDHENGAFALRKADDLGVDEWIGDVEDVQRDAGIAEGIRKAYDFERPQRRIVHSTLHHDAYVGEVAVEEFVELVLDDEFD